MGAGRGHSDYYSTPKRVDAGCAACGYAVRQRGLVAGGDVEGEVGVVVRGFIRIEGDNGGSAVQVAVHISVSFQEDGVDLPYFSPSRAHLLLV